MNPKFWMKIRIRRYFGPLGVGVSIGKIVGNTHRGGAETRRKEQLTADCADEHGSERAKPLTTEDTKEHGGAEERRSGGTQSPKAKSQWLMANLLQ
jgi:hypothetical protein